MLLQYNLNDFQDVNDFLSKLAAKMGCLRKGGIPDIHQAAQRVLSDWNNGRLTYFTEPPERPNDIISTELVTQMREAFDIDAAVETDLLMTEEDSFESEDDRVDEMEEDRQTSEEVVDLEGCSKVHYTVQAMDRSARLTKQRLADLTDKQEDDEIRRSIEQANLSRQQEFKKMKKNQKRSGRFLVLLDLFVSIGFSLEKSMENLGNAFDSIVQLTDTSLIEQSDDE